MKEGVESGTYPWTTRMAEIVPDICTVRSPPPHQPAVGLPPEMPQGSVSREQLPRTDLPEQPVPSRSEATGHPFPEELDAGNSLVL